MNVNLATHYDSEDETILDAIKEHQDILAGTGFSVTGMPVLVPDREFSDAGGYEVWSLVFDPETKRHRWAWVDPEGVVVLVDKGDLA